MNERNTPAFKIKAGMAKQELCQRMMEFLETIQTNDEILAEAKAKLIVQMIEWSFTRD